MAKFFVSILLLFFFCSPLCAYQDHSINWEELFSSSPSSYQSAAEKKEIAKKLAEATQKRQLYTERLKKEILRATPELNKVRYYLKQGANPAPVLPLAALKDNPPLLNLLYSYKDGRDWTSAEQKAVTKAIRTNKVHSFHTLMNKRVACAEPFDLNWNKSSSYWKPLSKEMLDGVVKRCYQTPQEKQIFLKDSLIRLNPGDHMVFRLGENYHRFITPKTSRWWVGSIRRMVNAGVKISDDTLFEIIAMGRTRTVDGDSFVPFAVTRELVILGIRGGASGRRVLARLDQADDNWAWQLYAREERKRLSNLLEGRPEREDRNVADRVQTAFVTFKNLF